jgi:hypothetical protein
MIECLTCYEIYQDGIEVGEYVMLLWHVSLVAGSGEVLLLCLRVFSWGVITWGFFSSRFLLCYATYVCYFNECFLNLLVSSFYFFTSLKFSFLFIVDLGKKAPSHRFNSHIFLRNVENTHR